VLRVIDEAYETIDGDANKRLLFPLPTGRAMSNATMSCWMERKGFEARPHGFRATFRTWVEKKTDAEYEDKEAALGHAVDTETVRTYQRSDRLEKRRQLLECWEKFYWELEQLGPNSIWRVNYLFLL